MQSVTRGLLLLVALCCFACAGGSSSPEDGDTTPTDGDWIWSDGDAPDGEADGEEDGDLDVEDTSCDPNQDAGYCDGSRRVYCARSTRNWESEDCAPGACEVFGEVSVCVTTDGDIDGDIDGDLDTEFDLDPETEPDGDIDEDGDLDEEIEDDQEIERELVIHLCRVSDQLLGPSCLDHFDCAEFCEPRVGEGCWSCDLDGVCRETDEGMGSCYAGDPDPEEEEEIPWECSELDPWTCSGNFLNYCNGGFWDQIDCAAGGQTCELDEWTGAQCGGTAVDGDDDQGDDPCLVNPSLVGPGLAVDDRELSFVNVPRESLTTRLLHLCNIGSLPLHISALHLEGFSASPFFVLPPDEGFPLLLESGESVGVSIAIYPYETGPYQAAVVVAGNDPQRPVVRVPLSATAQSIGRLRTVPAQTLRFPTGTPNSKELQVSNTGDLPLTLSLPEFVNDEGHYFPSGSDIHGTLAVGESKIYTISHSGNTRTASLVIPWTCTGCGTRSTTITLTTTPLFDSGTGCSTAPTSNDCPRAAALPDRDVYPLTTLALDARASYNPDGPLPQYRWSWFERPALATSDFLNLALAVITGQWGTTATPTVLLEQAGTYRPQLTVRDGCGQDCEAFDRSTAIVSVVPLSALYVSLMVAPGGGNHDLYLVRPGASLAVGDPANLGQCYAGNCLTDRHQAADCPPRGCPGPASAPDWGVTGVRGDDPMLLQAATGAGLEALMLDVLETGQYQVVVANVAGGGSTDFTVQVWVYGELKLERASRITQGNCYHERVATLTVTQDKGVTVTPVGTVHESGCL